MPDAPGFSASDLSSAAPGPFEDAAVRVRIGATGLRAEVSARGHAFAADEPAALGGTETGPTPYDLVAAALGTCTAMTLRLYADRKGWPLDGVDVHLTHARVHALDCAACEGHPRGMDEVTRVVTLRGPLSDEQRARLLEIADRCPVHETLVRGIRVVTRPG